MTITIWSMFISSSQYCIVWKIMLCDWVRGGGIDWVKFNLICKYNYWAPAINSISLKSNGKLIESLGYDFPIISISICWHLYAIIVITKLPKIQFYFGWNQPMPICHIARIAYGLSVPVSMETPIYTVFVADTHFKTFQNGKVLFDSILEI